MKRLHFDTITTIAMEGNEGAKRNEHKDEFNKFKKKITLIFM